MATNLVTGLGGPAGFGENVLPVGDDRAGSVSRYSVSVPISGSPAG